MPREPSRSSSPQLPLLAQEQVVIKQEQFPHTNDKRVISWCHLTSHGLTDHGFLAAPHLQEHISSLLPLPIPYDNPMLQDLRKQRQMASQKVPSAFIFDVTPIQHPHCKCSSRWSLLLNLPTWNGSSKLHVQQQVPMHFTYFTDSLNLFSCTDTQVKSGIQRIVKLSQNSPSPHTRNKETTLCTHNSLACNKTKHLVLLYQDTWSVEENNEVKRWSPRWDGQHFGSPEQQETTNHKII